MDSGSITNNEDAEIFDDKSGEESSLPESLRIHGQQASDDDLTMEETDNTDDEAESASLDPALDPLRKLEARQLAEEMHKKIKRSGVIYLSTIPTGMNVAKLREILSQYGELGRIYVEPDLRGVSFSLNEPF